MNYQSSKKGQRGQALILIALGAIGLFALSALAIDGSRSFSNKRHAQNTADTAALTAALRYIRNPSNATTEQARFDDAKAEAIKRIKSNGFDPDTNPNEVQVYIQRCDEPKDLQTGQTPLVCEGIDTAHASEYIRVRIVSTIPTTFGRVLGRPTLTAAAEAITRVQGGTSSSSGSGFSGAAMVAINDQDTGVCFRLNSGQNNNPAYVYTHDSGIFINCKSSTAIFMNTNAELNMDATGEVVGCYNTSSGNKDDPAYTHDPITCNVNGGVPKTYSESTFASVPTMPSVPACSGTAYRSGNKIYPGATGAGNVPGSLLPISSSIEFTAGTYCFSQDLNVQNHSTLTGTGKVTFVMGNNSVNLQSGETFNFQNLEVFSTSGTFRVGGSLTVNDRFRFYSSGAGDFTVLANASATTKGTYIYLKEGNISWESNSTINMKASDQGDPEGVGGLLVYKPWGNTKRITLNGGSNCVLYGTFLAPQSPITLNGQTGFQLHSQIIGWDYIVNGGAKADIWYNALENYNPPAGIDSSIEFIK